MCTFVAFVTVDVIRFREFVCNVARLRFFLLLLKTKPMSAFKFHQNEFYRLIHLIRVSSLNTEPVFQNVTHVG